MGLEGKRVMKRGHEVDLSGGDRGGKSMPIAAASGRGEREGRGGG